MKACRLRQREGGLTLQGITQEARATTAGGGGSLKPLQEGDTWAGQYGP